MKKCLSVLAALALLFVAGCNKGDNNGNKVPEGAVDLGLVMTRSDGTTYNLYWAACNLGASSPEEYGDYYAWGEVEPYYSQQEPLTWKEGKTGYSWASYRWCNGSSSTLTKYNTDRSEEYFDNKTVLETGSAGDDAASKKLGGKWRMPTDAEWMKLRTECEWTKTTQNGVTGHLVTGPNSNSIFLPSAGLRRGTNIIDEGTFGYYWSSSLDTEDPAKAWDVYFGFHPDGKSYARFNGQSIRPVSE